MRWKRDGYEVISVEHDADLCAFEVNQGDVVQTILPADIENMRAIFSSLDAGGDVDGWDDGMGGTILIRK